MKNLLGFLIPAALAVMAFLSKPADNECIDQVTGHYVGSLANSLVSATGAGALMYRVEDNIFWKTVYSQVSGNRVAVACFWNVFVN